MESQSSSSRTSYVEIVILDPSEMEDEVEYGGMLYELKKLGIQDGKAYQISNGGIMLMYRDDYEKCKKILNKFGVKAVNL
jgi:hypothetical protein